MRPLTLLVVVAAIALPWYVLVGIRTDGKWLRGFLGDHNLGRFRGAMEGHKGPIFYYIPAIMIGFFPWSVFLPHSLVQLVFRIRRQHAWRPAYILLACWSGLVVAVFSLAGTKLPSYVLPAYPALALITGGFVENWVRNAAAVSRWYLRACCGWLAVAGLGLLIALPLVSRQLLPGEGLLGVLGLVPLVGAAVVLWFAERSQSRQSAIAFGLTAVLLTTGVVGIAAARIGRHQNSALLVELARRSTAGEANIATFRYSSSSVVYYARAPVVRCQELSDVERFFKETARPYLIVDAGRLEQVMKRLPRDAAVLARQPRFLKEDGEVVLIGRKLQTASAVDGRVF